MDGLPASADMSPEIKPPSPSFASVNL